MANDKVLIEIVLDDGSVKKAFARISKDAKDAAGDSQQSFEKSGDGIADSLLGVGSKGQAAFRLVAGSVAAATAAVAVLKKGLDLALGGEREIAIDRIFDRLATAQGLPNLRNDLDAASKGLVDIGNILPQASQALANLNERSAELPKLLSLAVDSVKLFGGTAEDQFSNLVRAVETGNTRLLRQVGIVVDSEEVLSRYAATLGVTVGELNAAQRQQALLNRVLEEGSKRSAQAADDVAPLGTEYKRLSVNIALFSDEIKKSVFDTFGPAFQSVIGAAASALGDFVKFLELSRTATNNPATNVADLRAEIIRTEARIQSINNQLQTLAEGPKNSFDTVRQITNLRAELVTLTTALPKLNAEFEKTGALILNPAKAAAADTAAAAKRAAETAANNNKLTAEQIAAEQARAGQLLAFQLSSNQQFLAAETARVDALAAGDEKVFQQKALLGQRLLALGLQQQTEIDAAEVTFSAKAGFDLEQREAAKLAIIQKFNALRISEQDKVSLATEDRVRKNAEKIRDTINAVLLAGAAKAFASLGEKLVTTGFKFEDFANSLLGLLGDLAIAVGTNVLAQGLAIQALATSLGTLNAGPAIAAGGALIALGAGLKALAGGGASSSSIPAPGTPGGSPLITTPATETPIDEAVQDQGPQTSVNVNITGDILDSEETGLRIVDILNSAFDKQGVVIKRGVFA